MHRRLASGCESCKGVGRFELILGVIVLSLQNLAQFRLQLLDLLLVPTHLLFALLTGGRAEVLERFACVHELFLKRLAEALLLGQSRSLVAHLLRETLDVQVPLMQRQARLGMRVLLAGDRCGRAGQLRSQSRHLAGELLDLGLRLLAVCGSCCSLCIDALDCPKTDLDIRKRYE
jgi:hypothetical protein